MFTISIVKKGIPSRLEHEIATPRPRLNRGGSQLQRIGTRLKSRTTLITLLPPLTLRGELCVTGRREALASHYIFDQAWQ